MSGTIGFWVRAETVKARAAAVARFIVWSKYGVHQTIGFAMGWIRSRVFQWLSQSVTLKELVKVVGAALVEGTNVGSSQENA